MREGGQGEEALGVVGLAHLVLEILGEKRRGMGGGGVKQGLEGEMGGGRGG